MRFDRLLYRKIFDQKGSRHLPQPDRQPAVEIFRNRHGIGQRHPVNTAFQVMIRAELRRFSCDHSPQKKSYSLVWFCFCRDILAFENHFECQLLPLVQFHPEPHPMKIFR